uniref:Integrase, catalytic region, zinc finger, CCHC-type, peptidase aspartic, catalytic n=1 Tax=Tanacetum cinerariifolium TaxID=118510 RepID=A0A699GNF0_TANCI|nr:integrase, catalytic region, zinc finger, CCHC-type, peptidase aspartic, catalytic [Tanacetum cinerariifolium]
MHQQSNGIFVCSSSKEKGIWRDSILSQPRNGAWFKEKLMLAEAQEAGQILDAEQLAFLADPAFLMANLSSCDPEILFEVPYFDFYPNDMINQDVQEMQYYEQTHVDDFRDNEIHSGSNIIPVIAKENIVISVLGDEETLILKEESRSKMLDKQNDPISIEKKIKISPIDYSKLNKIKEDFGKYFVTQKELSAEQAFWLKHSSFSETPVRHIHLLESKLLVNFLRLKNNRDAHEVYIEKTIEYTDTLCRFVERTRTQYPSEPLLESACMFTKHVQEFNALIKHSVRNAKFESICAIYNKCLFDANNHICLIDFVNDVNVRLKSKSKRNKMRKAWKPMGKVFTDVGYKWKPTERFFTIVGDSCPLTRDPMLQMFYFLLLLSMTGCPDRPLESELRMFKTYEREPLSAHEIRVDLLSCSRDTNLNTISLDDMLKTSPICLLSKALKTKSWLWHHRLSHLNFGTLNKLAKDGLVRDAPSSNIPSTQEKEHSLKISQGVKESPKTPLFHDDPLHEDLTSKGSSSNVRPSHTLFELIGRWTKDHPIANVIDDPFCLVSTKKQLKTNAMWCYFDSFLTSVEPKNFKQAMTEPSWIDAMQEEIHEI